MASEHPALAIALGESLATESRQAGDPAAEALAMRAVALARRPDDAGGARRTTLAAVEIAQAAGQHEVADRVRVTLAGIAALSGQFAEAADILDGVVQRALPRAEAEARAQLAFISFYHGELERALVQFDECLAVLPPDDVWTANALGNRGLTRAYLGDLPGAERDLFEAIALYSGHSCAVAVAESQGNLGWVMALRGDYVGALEAFAVAERELRRLGFPLGYVMRDRAHTLIAVGLAGPAADDARRSAEEFERGGLRGEHAESLRTLAVAHELAGDAVAAERFGAEAAAVFLSEGRAALADQAMVVALRARASRHPDEHVVEELHALAERVSDAAAENVALEAQLAAAAAAMRTGDTVRASADLALVERARWSPRPDLRLAYWQTAAEVRLAAGQTAASLHAVRQALRVLHESQRTLGATEARVNLAATAHGLGRVALAATLEGPSRRLFGWIERLRASALRYRPVRPDDDSELERDRAELRLVSRQLAGPDASVRGALVGLEHRQVELERSIRYRLLTTPGGRPAVAFAGAGDVQRLLDDEIAVSYSEHGGRIVAVCLDRAGAATIDIGDIDQIRAELAHVRAGLVRLASGRSSRLTVQNVGAGLQRLDALLLAPLVGHGHGLVIVPTGELLPVPWTVLPSARGRPVTVAPSASLWAESRRRRSAPASPGARVVLAAGPGLAHAEAEIAALTVAYPRAADFGPSASTAGQLLAAIDGADLFHIACHGVFRADNPLFSHLRVADGPLALHDLEELAVAPATVVLSACDSGRAQPRPGDEWLGLASTLLTLGTRSLVASVLPVPDSPATIALMVALHDELRTGCSPAAALSALAAPDLVDDPVAFTARAAFLVFGG